MNTSVGGLLLGLLTLVSSCSSNSSSSPASTSDGSDGGTQGSSSGGVSADAGGAPGVSCTHPGAGKNIGGDRCECTTTRNVAGEWNTLRTCREGDVCPSKNKEDVVVLTQTGTTVNADRGANYAFTGTLCGDVLVWSGGPKDGLNPECGQIRFSDDSHYLSDSCFVAAGACSPTFGEGCPSLKGQCTGTGVKKPDPATPIKKVICN